MFNAYIRLSPLVDKSQISLSEKFIHFQIESISKELEKLRSLHDNLWFDKLTEGLSNEEISFLKSKIQRIKKKYPASFIAKYPIGHCFHITSTIVEYIEKHEINKSSSCLSLLAPFILEGGTFKKIWGMHKKSHFQTAIQIGEWYVDIAADTFDKQNKQVEFCLIKEAEFAAFTSIEEYHDILQNEENKKLYFNSLFPELWPYFPFLLKSKNKVSIPESKYLSGLCTHNHFEAIKNALTSNKIEMLPQHELDTIAQKINRVKDSYLHKEYLQNRNIAKNEFPSLLIYADNERADILKAVNYINFILNNVK